MDSAPDRLRLERRLRRVETALGLRAGAPLPDDVVERVARGLYRRMALDAQAHYRWEAENARIRDIYREKARDVLRLGEHEFSEAKTA